ncbi:hypothetical protein ACJA88_015318 [Fusarium oxysporum]
MAGPAKDSEPSRTQPRINSACLNCRKRKAKCDGQGPSCQQCSKREIECVYQQRKFRGPGKSKEHAQKLEERLKRLEDSLQRSDEALQKNVNIRSGNDEHTLGDDTPTTPTAVSQNLMRPQTSQEASTSGPGTQTVKRALPGFVPVRSFPTPGARFSRMLLQAEIDTVPFRMARFGPHFSHEDTIHLIDDIADEISEVYPLLTMSHLESLITPQDLDSSVDSAARIAIANVALAMAFQWKAANPAFKELSPLAWGYFKTAMSICPLLLFQGSSVPAYEAILIMAMFMQGTGDIHNASYLNTFAVRAVQMFDAANPLKSLTPGVHGAENRMRVFWTLAALDVDMSFRLGIPPAMIMMVDLANGLPSEISSDQIGRPIMPGVDHPIDIIKYRAQLTKIQFDDLVKKLPFQAIIMHLVFHDLKAKVQVAMNASSLEASAASARAIVQLMHHLPTHQFTGLWRVLVYPISATLLLLAAIVHNPVNPSVQSNLKAMQQFSRFINVCVQREGCSLGAMLEWSIKIEKKAADLTSDVSLVENQETRQRLRQFLSPQTDCLRLAQSLMGRMTAFDADRIRQLWDILEMHWSPADEFGPLVLDVVKPKTYNFSWTFGGNLKTA